MALRLDSPAGGTPSPWDASPRSTGILQIVGVGCGTLAGIEPQALGMTYWFDAAPDGEPYTAVVRFVGHRIGLNRAPGPGDSFIVSETVKPVMPGSGRLAITARVADIAPGEWSVNATVTTQRHSTPGVRPSTEPPKPLRVSASGATGFAPLVGVRAPGAHLGAWPGLVGVGVGVALTVQSGLAARAHLPVVATLTVSVIASAIGLLGARIYYLAEQGRRLPGHPRQLLTAGMCIQGFVVADIAAASIGTLVAGIPLGRYLDATAPALLFGMTIGRFGCFFGGCCAGRPTASRWGLWSSDRRVGTRRIPTQLLESALAFVLGIVALLAVLRRAVEPAGAAFVGAIAAYTIGRQLLFPWRDLPRKTSRGRIFTVAVATAVVLVDVVFVLLV